MLDAVSSNLCLPSNVRAEAKLVGDKAPSLTLTTHHPVHHPTSSSGHLPATYRSKDATHDCNPSGREHGATDNVRARVCVVQRLRRSNHARRNPICWQATCATSVATPYRPTTHHVVLKCHREDVCGVGADVWAPTRGGAKRDACWSGAVSPRCSPHGAAPPHPLSHSANE